MPVDLMYYQIINKTGSELDLVATVQNPNNWVPAPPATIAAGGNPSFDSNGNPGAIVFGYEIKGSSTEQFWVIANGNQVTQFAPSGHSIGVNVTGDSEDGWSVTLTYQ
jgi:hypothetical protein